MKIKEGGEMDLQKEREAFQKFCEENFDFERHEQTYFDEQTRCYENDIGEDTESINMAWSAWQAAKAQAVPEVISIGSELQSWVAVNSFGVEDAVGNLAIVDANELAELIEKLTGASQ